MKTYREAIKGQFVTPEFADANPDTTVAESAPKSVPKEFWHTQVAYLENLQDWHKSQIEHHKSEIDEMETMQKFAMEQLKK